ncbi:hypothetical protein LguiA_018458 [Lonicera macranthoides]
MKRGGFHFTPSKNRHTLEHTHMGHEFSSIKNKILTTLAIGTTWGLLIAMAMAKFFAFLLLALLTISFLQTTVASGGHHNNRNADHNAIGGAARPSTTMHAYFSATNVAPSASVCHLDFMATKLCALATITGRPRKEDQNALNFLGLYYYLSWSKCSGKKCPALCENLDRTPPDFIRHVARPIEIAERPIRASWKPIEDAENRLYSTNDRSGKVYSMFIFLLTLFDSRVRRSVQEQVALTQATQSEA